ncbi:Alpha/beta knot methyltransferase [Choanephora cucurbitarum]|nr:Alpha/beta knot methyltransferase [Choanephora cucurbitarum]
MSKLFKEITSQHNAVAKHWIALREKKQYRLDHKSVLVQGAKTIRELHKQGCKIASLAITTSRKDPEMKQPGLSVFKDPSLLPANQYYLADINVVRRALGTSSKPAKHDIFAEIPIPEKTEQEVFKQDRLLVFDKITDPGNLGTLVRTAKALGWHAGVNASGTCDLYNDKTVRASRGLTVVWPHVAYPNMRIILDHLREQNYTPLVADMLPKDTKSSDLWSPEYNTLEPGRGIWFWNFQNGPFKEVPKRVALILSSEHHGVGELLDKEIKVSLPMYPGVESLNVANAGSIIMSELNRSMF